MSPKSRASRSRPRLVLLAAASALSLGLAGAGLLALLGGFDRTFSARAGGDEPAQVALVDALVGFDVTPDELRVRRGSRLVLQVVNEADGPHDLAAPDGPGTRTLARGGSQRVDLGVVTGATPRQLWCTLPGHKAAGMSLDIRVVPAR